TEGVPAFRASGSAFTFTHQEVTDGLLNVFATPGADYSPVKPAILGGDQDSYALVIRNLNKPTEGATEGKVVSNYVVAKDERSIPPDLYLSIVNSEGDPGYNEEEYTIKTSLTADRNRTDLGDNEGDFTRTPEISLEIGKSLDLATVIRPFFQRYATSEFKSFDDHGLRNYTLKF